MTKKEFFLNPVNSEGKIYCAIWLTKKPKAIVQIVHGITEHLGRYDKLINFLIEKEICVVGMDLLGHGKSVNKNPMYFGSEGSWHDRVEDNYNLHIEAKKHIGEDIPYFILGFSLGSFIAREFLIKYPDKLDGAIIIGTGQQNKLATFLGKFMAKKVAKQEGEANFSKVINDLAFGNYNKYFKPTKTNFDWLCANTEELQNYENDELAIKNVTPGLFRELLIGMEYTAEMNNIEKMNSHVPILLLSGENDAVGDFSKGVKKVATLFKKINSNVQMVIYNEGRHDILHEVFREKVFKDIVNWIEKILTSNN